MLQSVGEERLLSSSSEKLLHLEKQQSVEIGATCSQKVAAIYQDSRCMDTTINVSVPDRIDTTKMFNFDEAYFRKCHDASQTNHCLNDLVLRITLFYGRKKMNIL